MNRVVVFVIGLMVGIMATAMIGRSAMPAMMLEVRESRLTFEETVAAIEKSAADNGWQVPKIYDMRQSLVKAGYENMTNLRVLSMCQPDHAYRILSEDENKMVSAMMPCRIGVFEDKDGRVLITQMNVGLMSKMFGGTIEEVMSRVASEEEKILENIIKK